MCDVTPKETQQECCLKQNLKGHKKPLTSISFCPNSNQFASSAEENSLLIWNMTQNHRTFSFSGHTDIVTSIDYSPNGKFLASCSKDKTVRIWETTGIRGKTTQFTAHTSPITTVQFSPDNSKILTGSHDKSIKLWNPFNNQFLGSYLGHNNWIRQAQFTSDGQFIVSCSDDNTFRVWDVEKKQCIHAFNMASKGGPSALSVHNSGTSVLIAMASGSVRLYDIRSNKLQQHYQLHDFTTSVCWHPCANYFASCGKDGHVIIVDVMEGRPLYTISGHDGTVNCIKFDPKGTYFATGGMDRHLMLWETNI